MGNFITDPTAWVCRAATCGDGLIQPGEECDDADTDNNAGFCSSTCTRRCSTTGVNLPVGGSPAFVRADLFQNHCYLYTDDQSDYADAVAACAALAMQEEISNDAGGCNANTCFIGGTPTPATTGMSVSVPQLSGTSYLARPNSGPENTRIAMNANAAGLGHIWLGGSDLATEGSFRWLDGAAFTGSFQFWATAAQHPSMRLQPDGDEDAGTPNADEDCVIMSTDMGDTWYARWADTTCGVPAGADMAGYVCEYQWPTP